MDTGRGLIARAGRPPWGQMEFQVGDIVVKPTIGVCRIADRKRVEVDGSPKEFFVFHAGEISVMVPVTNVERVGIRRPMNGEEGERVWKCLGEPLEFAGSDAAHDAYRKLHPGDIKDTIRRRLPDELAELCRLLYNKSREQKIERKQKEFFEQVLQMLAEELAYIEERDPLEVNKALREALQAGYEERKKRERG